MLSTSNIERLIAEKRREIEKEKIQLGLSRPSQEHTASENNKENAKHPKKLKQQVRFSDSKALCDRNDSTKDKEEKASKETHEEIDPYIPADLERYIRRYIGLPVMLKAGEYSPNNPLVRGERAPGDALLGLGEYERRRNTLRKIRQQQYREYLDQQAKKKQEAKEQAERERREREQREREREERERELIEERNRFSPDRRRSLQQQQHSSVGVGTAPAESHTHYVPHLASPAIPTCNVKKVDTGVQVDGFSRPLSVAVQTDQTELCRLSPSPTQCQLTQAERELSPRTVHAWPPLAASHAPQASHPTHATHAPRSPPARAPERFVHETQERRRSYGDFDGNYLLKWPPLAASHAPQASHPTHATHAPRSPPARAPERFVHETQERRRSYGDFDGNYLLKWPPLAASHAPQASHPTHATHAPRSPPARAPERFVHETQERRRSYGDFDGNYLLKWPPLAASHAPQASHPTHATHAPRSPPARAPERFVHETQERRRSYGDFDGNYLLKWPPLAASHAPQASHPTHATHAPRSPPARAPERFVHETQERRRSYGDFDGNYLLKWPPLAASHAPQASHPTHATHAPRSPPARAPERFVHETQERRRSYGDFDGNYLLKWPPLAASHAPQASHPTHATHAPRSPPARAPERFVHETQERRRSYGDFDGNYLLKWPPLAASHAPQASHPTHATHAPRSPPARAPERFVHETQERRRSYGDFDGNYLLKWPPLAASHAPQASHPTHATHAPRSPPARAPERFVHETQERRRSYGDFDGNYLLKWPPLAASHAPQASHPTHATHAPRSPPARAPERFVHETQERRRSYGDFDGNYLLKWPPLAASHAPQASHPTHATHAPRSPPARAPERFVHETQERRRSYGDFDGNYLLKWPPLAASHAPQASHPTHATHAPRSPPARAPERFVHETQERRRSYGDFDGNYLLKWPPLAASHAPQASHPTHATHAPRSPPARAPERFVHETQERRRSYGDFDGNYLLKWPPLAASHAPQASHPTHATHAPRSPPARAPERFVHETQERRRSYGDFDGNYLLKWPPLAASHAPQASHPTHATHAPRSPPARAPERFVHETQERRRSYGDFDGNYLLKWPPLAASHAPQASHPTHATHAPRSPPARAPERFVHETQERRRSYGDFDERGCLLKKCNRDKLTSDLRHTYMPSIFDADAIRLRNLQAEKEAAERRQFYQQELKNQIMEQQRIKEERKTREKMLEQAEMRRLEEQLRMLRAAQDGERGRQHHFTHAMKENAVEYNNKRSDLQREIDAERHKLLRVASQPARASHGPTTNTSHSQALPSKLPFYYPKILDRTDTDKKPYSINIQDNSIFSSNYDVDSYLRRNLNFNKDKVPKIFDKDDLDTPQSHTEKRNIEKSTESIVELDNNVLVEKALVHERPEDKTRDDRPKEVIQKQPSKKVVENVDCLPIPVLRHSPTTHKKGIENTSMSEAMKKVDDKWKVPAVQKNILKALPNEEGKNVSILTQLGSIRRQLQLEQLKMDKMLSKDDEV